jgi:predicted enzyme related to lactoylglutathione lyase
VTFEKWVKVADRSGVVAASLSVAAAWLWLFIGELLSRSEKVLRKIDCVMIRVEDVEAAAAYYAKVFGLRPLWSGEGAVGLVFPETDAEIVLHRETTIPSSVEVYYKVDDVVVAVAHYAAQGCQILVAPFDITIGKCAVIRDPFGTRLCILDTTKGHRPSNLAEPQGLM